MTDIFVGKIGNIMDGSDCVFSTSSSDVYPVGCTFSGINTIAGTNDLTILSEDANGQQSTLNIDFTSLNWIDATNFTLRDTRKNTFYGEIYEGGSGILYTTPGESVTVDFTPSTVSQVPEPNPALLFGTSLVLLGLSRKKILNTMV